jgi:hypothetical protein
MTGEDTFAANKSYFGVLLGQFREESFSYDWILYSVQQEVWFHFQLLLCMLSQVWLSTCLQGQAVSSEPVSGQPLTDRGIRHSDQLRCFCVLAEWQSFFYCVLVVSLQCMKYLHFCLWARLCVCWPGFLQGQLVNWTSVPTGGDFLWVSFLVCEGFVVKCFGSLEWRWLWNLISVFNLEKIFA